MTTHFRSPHAPAALAKGPGRASFLAALGVATVLLPALFAVSQAEAQPRSNTRASGVTLFDQDDFRGRSQFVDQDTSRLGIGGIGDNRARSVIVDPGCTVTLYSDSGFRGVSFRSNGDLASLRRTPVGADSVSSLEVDCRQGQRGGDRDSDWDDGNRGNRGNRGGWGEGRRGDDPWGDDGRVDDGWGNGELGNGDGAVLYGDDQYRGARVRFDRDVAELGRTGLGNDRASSLRVARGCRVTLYADSGFRGAQEEFEEDVPDLGRTLFGNDRASSARIECRRQSWNDGFEDAWGGGWSGRKGVVVYSDEGFRGRSEFLVQDDDRLSNNAVGNDSISSLRVSPGCRVTLHENDRFTGRSDVFRGDMDSLRGTRIGNDSASSIEVRCAGQGGNTGGDFGFGDGLTLYADSDFRGAKETFEVDMSDLGRSRFGNDRASSLRVARGCQATLYEDANYRGRSMTVRSDVPDLGDTAFGNDRVSSIRVDCRRRR